MSGKSSPEDRAGRQVTLAAERSYTSPIDGKKVVLFKAGEKATVLEDLGPHGVKVIHPIYGFTPSGRKTQKTPLIGHTWIDDHQLVKEDRHQHG